MSLHYHLPSQAQEQQSQPAWDEPQSHGLSLPPLNYFRYLLQQRNVLTHCLRTTFNQQQVHHDPSFGTSHLRQRQVKVTGMLSFGGPSDPGDEVRTFSNFQLRSHSCPPWNYSKEVFMGGAGRPEFCSRVSFLGSEGTTFPHQLVGDCSESVTGKHLALF